VAAAAHEQGPAGGFPPGLAASAGAYLFARVCWCGRPRLSIRVVYTEAGRPASEVDEVIQFRRASASLTRLPDDKAKT
jgi:hypothetical protein